MAPRLFLRGVLAEERRASSAAVVRKLAPQRPQPNQQPILLDLRIVHSRARAAKAAIGPDDLAHFGHRDSFAADAEATRQIVDGDIHESLNCRFHGALAEFSCGGCGRFGIRCRCPGALTAADQHGGAQENPGPRRPDQRPPSFDRLCDHFLTNQASDACASRGIARGFRYRLHLSVETADLNEQMYCARGATANRLEKFRIDLFDI